MKCSKCKSAMEVGVLMSITGLASFPTFWAKNVKDGSKGKRDEVQAMKCAECGNVELQATE